MKQHKHKSLIECPSAGRPRGLTLLEMILALTFVSGIVLAGSALNLSAGRSTMMLSQEVKLRNDLEYILKRIEQGIRDRQDVTFDLHGGLCAPGHQRQCFRAIQYYPGHFPDHSDNDYAYDPASSELWINESLVSSGILKQKPGANAGDPPVPVFKVRADGLVEVTLGASRQIQIGTSTRTIQVPPITRIIPLRRPT